MATNPLSIAPDLAVVGLRAWTSAGDRVTTSDTSFAALDFPDHLRRVYVHRGRRPWRPPKPSNTIFPPDVADRLQGLADKIAPHIDPERTDDDPER